MVYEATLAESNNRKDLECHFYYILRRSWAYCGVSTGSLGLLGRACCKFRSWVHNLLCELGLHGDDYIISLYYTAMASSDLNSKFWEVYKRVWIVEPSFHSVCINAHFFSQYYSSEPLGRSQQSFAFYKVCRKCKTNFLSVIYKPGLLPTANPPLVGACQ